MQKLIGWTLACILIYAALIVPAARKYGPMIRNLAAPSAETVFTGEETPLVSVKASPRRYINCEFIVTGFAKISDYYNYGYADYSDYYYSVSFVEMIDDVTRGERVHCYMERDRGPFYILANMLARVEAQHGSPTPVCLRLTIDESKYKDARSWDTCMRVVDFRFYDTEANRWDDWCVENFVATE